MTKRTPKDHVASAIVRANLAAEARASCKLDGETHHDCRCQCGRRAMTVAEAVLLVAAQDWAEEKNVVLEMYLRSALRLACSRVRKERQ